MGQSQKDLGVITALMDRFENERLPRALEIRAKVGNGDKLSDSDVDFLDRVLNDVKNNKATLGKFPEYQGLIAKVVGLYHEIMDLAVKNEKTG